MKLIVNADDLGLCTAVNTGIEEAFQKGIVRSTTILVNGEAYGEALDCARRNPGLGVGIHLNLTLGAPLIPTHKTLLTPDGSFRRDNQKPSHPIDPSEVRAEWQAQIEQALRDGLVPTHLDSHHHVHMLPQLLPVFLELAHVHQLPVRMTGVQELAARAEVPCPARFIGAFHGQQATLDQLDRLLSNSRNQDIVELMCHPAHPSAYLEQISSYSHPRMQELAVLTSSGAWELIHSRQVELVKFSIFSVAK